MNYYDAIKARRSRYQISEASPISDNRIEEIVANAINETPSAFNSQTSRAVLLFGDRHKKLWSIVMETLRAKVPADKFAPTEAKVNSFAAGHGTILYFEDMDTIASLQKNFVAYADNFPTWSNQSAGMLQYSIWTALSMEDLGANLQHYNPIIDEEVSKEFNIPENWKLLAQMPFGAPTGEAGPKEFLPIEKRLVVQKSEN